MNFVRKNLNFFFRERSTNPTALSQATGVPQPTIHRILKGTSGDPRTATLQPLADYFGVTVESLRSVDFEREGNPGAGRFETPAAVYGSDQPANPERKQGRATAPIGLSMQARLTRSFIKALPRELQQNADREAEAGGLSFRLDYHSDKLAAEVAALILQTRDGRAWGGSTLALVRALWKLSCYRLLTKDSAPDRACYLFAVIVNDLGGPMPMKTIGRISAEAALHGIQVVWGSSEGAATLVEAIESGKIKPGDPVETNVFHDDSPP